MVSEVSIVPSTQQVNRAIDRVNILSQIIRTLRSDTLQVNVDYGVIPGTGDKPTLLLPGMEKLMRALNAVPEYVERRVIVDYDRPLFHYEYECRLVDADTGLAIPGGRGLGLCTSMETSFRWRKAERTCPNCGEPAVIKGKAEYGGGWLCFAKKGGCGAKFRDGDPAIEGQPVGRVENPDIFDQVNAIMKRAKKRALGDAIKGAANVSEFFTVDLEDLPHIALRDDVVDATFTVEQGEAAAPDATKSQPVQANTEDRHVADQPQRPHTPATPDVTPNADGIPDPLFQRLMGDSSVQDASKNGAHRANTIRKMWAEGKLTADMDEADMVLLVVERLQNPKGGAK